MLMKMTRDSLLLLTHDPEAARFINELIPMMKNSKGGNRTSGADWCDAHPKPIARL